MTTDTKLLPLPECAEIVGGVVVAMPIRGLNQHIRANIEASTKALRADLADYMRIANTEATRAERLAEALRPLAELDLTADDFDQRPDSQPIYARNKTVITVGDVRKARAALHPRRLEDIKDEE